MTHEPSWLLPMWGVAMYFVGLAVGKRSWGPLAFGGTWLLLWGLLLVIRPFG